MCSSDLDFLKSWEGGCFWWHNRSWRYLWLGLFYSLCFRNSCSNYWWLRFSYHFCNQSCSNICGILCFYNRLGSVCRIRHYLKCDSICISHACVTLLPARAKYPEYKSKICAKGVFRSQSPRACKNIFLMKENHSLIHKISTPFP